MEDKRAKDVERDGRNQIDYRRSKSVIGQSQEESYVCFSRRFDMIERREMRQ